MFLNRNQQRKDALLYQAYFKDVYQNRSPYRRFTNDEFLALQEQGICAIYGEMEFESVEKLLEYANLTEEDIFLDLGSGNGKLLTQIFLQSKAKLCLGIEAMENLVQQANSIKDELFADLNYQSQNQHDLQFVAGNFIHTSWQGATQVYTCSTCYTKALLSDIGEKINQEQSVRKAFSLKPLPTLTRLPLRRVFRVECSWDSALCFYYGI